MMQQAQLTTDDDAHTSPDLPQALRQLGACVLDLMDSNAQRMAKHSSAQHSPQDACVVTRNKSSRLSRLLGTARSKAAAA